jgi:hypothetical protein
MPYLLERERERERRVVRGGRGGGERVRVKLRRKVLVMGRVLAITYA